VSLRHLLSCHPLQRQAIDLPIPRAWQRVEKDRAVDKNVAGQPLGAMPLGLEQRELATSDEERDEARLDPRSDRCYGGLRDVRMPEQRRLDLTELNA
jgi:hypothetical protein